MFLSGVNLAENRALWSKSLPMEKPTQKKLFIKTWGCQMNVYDSRRMSDILAPLGYSTTENPEDADMVILNTCHIREKATEKVFSEIGRLRDIKADRKLDGKETLIAVAGCVAQAEGEYIMQRATSAVEQAMEQGGNQVVVASA